MNLSIKDTEWFFGGNAFADVEEADLTARMRVASFGGPATVTLITREGQPVTLALAAEEADRWLYTSPTSEHRLRVFKA